MTQADAKDPHRNSVWQTVLTWLRAWDEAAAFDYNDVQDRRIQALEREIAVLRTDMAKLRNSLPSF